LIILPVLVAAPPIKVHAYLDRLAHIVSISLNPNEGNAGSTNPTDGLRVGRDVATLANTSTAWSLSIARSRAINGSAAPKPFAFQSAKAHAKARQRR